MPSNNERQSNLPGYVWHLLLLTALLAVGQAGIIWVRAGYDNYQAAFGSVLFWQLAVWAPWLVFGYVVAQLTRRLPFSTIPTTRWFSMHVGCAVAVTLIHYVWFRFVSSNISPYVGLEATRYGVFAYFFVFWSALDLALYALILTFTQNTLGNRRVLELKQQLSQSSAMKRTDYLTVYKTGQRLVLPTKQLRWIEAEGYYAGLHTETGHFLLRESLANLSKKLDAGQFIRVHRSTIVNMAFVRKFGPDDLGRWSVILNDGTLRRVSRSGRHRLAQHSGEQFEQRAY